MEKDPKGKYSSCFSSLYMMIFFLSSSTFRSAPFQTILLIFPLLFVYLSSSCFIFIIIQTLMSTGGRSKDFEIH